MDRAAGLAWLPNGTAETYQLRHAMDVSIALAGTEIVGGSVVALSPKGTLQTYDSTLGNKWPHLRSHAVFELPETVPAADMLKSQLVAVALRADGTVADSTTVQYPGVIDALYAYDGPLGATFAGQTPTLRLWAHARWAKVERLDANLAPIETLDMSAGPSGIWVLEGQASWYGTYYRYELEVYHPTLRRVITTKVTDPYSVSLATDSVATQILNLDDPATKPPGWDDLVKPATLEAPEDVTIYELHVRDFSIWDTTVPAEHRGKYLAFTHTGDNGSTKSNGMAHLERWPTQASRSSTCCRPSTSRRSSRIRASGSRSPTASIGCAP
ncbi:MAG: hypothetical protein HC923_06390 [Myxococcales bacterium]|nr:hypothetical protein [Myxococcales bacterium]